MKHPKELFISAFTRGNACFLSRETTWTTWTQNMQKSGFCLLLQAFVCICIWKNSGFSCVSTNLISCLNRSRLGMCYSEQFITGLCTTTVYRKSCTTVCRKSNQQPAAPKQANSKVSNVIWEIWAFWLWWEWFHGGKHSRLSCLFFWYLLKSVPWFLSLPAYEHAN